MKLKHAKTPMPKTAKEALLMLPESRKRIGAMTPEARAITMKGLQRKLDQVNKA